MCSLEKKIRFFEFYLWFGSVQTKYVQHKCFQSFRGPTTDLLLFKQLCTKRKVTIIFIKSIFIRIQK